MTRGFSLIETIIYIALLGLLLSGAIVTAYQITQNSYLLAGKNTTQEEGSFVLRKIEQAFVGARDIPTMSGSTLEIDAYSGPNRTFTWSAGGPIKLDNIPLTTDRVSVDGFSLVPHAGPPKGVTITLTIDGKVFTLTRYVR